MVVEGVEYDLDVVVLHQHGVPPHLRRHDPFRTAVIAAHRDIEGRFIVCEPDSRFFRRLLSGVRLCLDKIVDAGLCLPGRLIQDPVDFNVSGETAYGDVVAFFRLKRHEGNCDRGKRK